MNKDLTMIDVGHVTDKCALVLYKHAIVKHVGQVACAKINIRSGYSGTLSSRSQGMLYPTTG